MTDRERLAQYFARNRETAIRRYKAATLWVQRIDARKSALHYSQLLRKLS